MVKNSQKLIILMFSFILLYFLIPSSIGTLSTGNISGSNIILVNQNLENRSVPIGRSGLLTFWENMYGSIPTSIFYYQHTGLTTLGVGFSRGEIAFIMNDNSDYGFISAKFSLSNVTHYEGGVEILCEFYPQTNIYWYAILLAPNSTAGKEFIRLDIYILQNSSIRLDYRDISGAHYLNNVNNVTYFKLGIFYSLITQTWLFNIYNLETSSIIYSKSNLNFRGDCLSITNLLVCFYSSPVQIGLAKMTVYALDFTGAIGYYPSRILDFGYVTYLGYYGQKSLILNLFPNYSDKTIKTYTIDANFTFLIDFSYYRYYYLTLENATILKNNETTLRLIEFSMRFINVSIITVGINILSISNKSNTYFTYNIDFIINYTLFPLSLFKLYLSASIPLTFIALLPLFGYKIGNKRKEVYWFSLFATILSVVIWRGIFLTLGGIIAITSILIILIEKYRGEHNDY